MTKIENEQQYQWAVDRVEAILPKVTDETPTDDPNYIELVLLSNLVADYDEENYPVETPSLVDILKLRMYEMGLTQSALAKRVGVSAARMCEYLSGHKEPTVKVLREMVRQLDIDPAIALGV